jgi:hypothetical protein
MDLLAFLNLRRFPPGLPSFSCRCVQPETRPAAGFRLRSFSHNPSPKLGFAG